MPRSANKSSTSRRVKKRFTRKITNWAATRPAPPSVHPGGPFWAKKDEGSWSIPKGEYNEAEDALAAAKRELREETGVVVAGEFLELGTFNRRCQGSDRANRRDAALSAAL
jgi:8-oxo-dGTP pyrophosphatase MutT (NUDIX family)